MSRQLTIHAPGANNWNCIPTVCEISLVWRTNSDRNPFGPSFQTKCQADITILKNNFNLRYQRIKCLALLRSELEFVHQCTVESERCQFLPKNIGDNVKCVQICPKTKFNFAGPNVRQLPVIKLVNCMWHFLK